MSDKKRKTALSLRLSSLNDVEYEALQHFHQKHKGSVRAYAQMILLMNELAGDLDFSQPLEVAKFLQSTEQRTKSKTDQPVTKEKDMKRTSTARPTRKETDEPKLDLDSL
ncbi:hypothetical protein EXIGUO8H_200002 [Exiguobacterium sp. 8H]|uniref:hypothetical protein n=1 Tax=unclassified Exiguobacterium TaxID=2644629 RepID=UPI0012F37DB2|nr:MULTISPECIES: hypothetical protein [unclassified Exiguobacterium]VXB80745.1 hypothetical protein EXIGUO8H_200002 [Exiguobacterium sp. 8H]VXB93143.1 hypothetical protein EXIGUO8A_260018 [Exiguobacterium sp. 8A]